MSTVKSEPGTFTTDTCGSTTVPDDPCGGLDWDQGLAALAPVPAAERPALLARLSGGRILPPFRHGGGPRSDAESLARLLLEQDADVVLVEVEALLAQGMPLERLFLELLAPVARRLGQWWEEDRASFAEVTLGLARLHQILHETARRAEGRASAARNLRALFVPAPGEQHTFGLAMVEEFFGQAGWQTHSDHGADRRRTLDFVASDYIDMVGITLGCRERIHGLIELIRGVRLRSKNRGIAVLVGGRVFLDHPELQAGLSGLAIVTDGVHAVRTAEDVVGAG